MAKYAHAYVIPAQGILPGGTLYDKYGNFSYFVSVDGLEDKAKTTETRAIPVKAANVNYYMRSAATFARNATTRNVTVGAQLSKGATPGVPILLDDGNEQRTFMYDGNQSALYAYVSTNAAMSLTMYGPTGVPYAPVVVE